MSALPRTALPRVRRRWPTAAFVLGVIGLALLCWRMATARAVESLPPAGVPIRVTRAVDGDTLLLDGGYRIRLLGVNTPETKHPDRPAEPFGPEASAFTQSLVEHRMITLEFDRERLDNYRRILAYVYLEDGTLLNQRLIESGFSPAVVSFPIRSDRKRLFEETERAAQQKQRGIWTLPEWQTRLAQQREREAQRKR